MAGADEPFESLRPSKGMLHCERVNSVISPVPLARALGYRHHFDGRDSEVLQFVQMLDRCIEGAFRREGSDVKFVENVVLQ